MQDDPSIPLGLCQCGCGQLTGIMSKNYAQRGLVAGKPRRFLPGHNFKTATPKFDIEDRGYITPCHIWRRCVQRLGYGVDTRNGRSVLAHKAAWEDVNGPVPDGLELDHLCVQRACVRIDHLEAITHTENIRRGSQTKLTVEIVREIRSQPRSVKHAELAERYNVTISAIENVRYFKSWKDVA